MESLLFTGNIILAVLLVISILMQKSEGGALGIGVSQDSMFSSRSAGNILTKITATLATLFIICSLCLTILSSKEFSSISVIDKIEENQDSSEPKIPKSDQ